MIESLTKASRYQLTGLKDVQIQLTEVMVQFCPILSVAGMAKNDNTTIFCLGYRRSTRENRKMLFNVHQGFCCCVNFYMLQPDGSSQTRLYGSVEQWP